MVCRVFHSSAAIALLVFLSMWAPTSVAFLGTRTAFFSTTVSLQIGHSRRIEPLYLSTTDPQSAAKEDAAPAVCGVAAPLLRMGPYPLMELGFPDFGKQEGESRNDTMVLLKFILDTGASVNSISPNLVQKYKLKKVFSARDVLGSAGIGGAMAPGDVYLLGDCHLHGLPAEQDKITFLHNLTAASFPSPPGLDGILGQTFFRSFLGVGFDWHGSEDGAEPPTIQFLFTEEILEFVQQNMTRVPLQRRTHLEDMKSGGLLWMNVTVNGVELPALLDTGSPATILNEKAAKLVGITKVEDTKSKTQEGKDVVTVAGIDGRPIHLYRSQSEVSISAQGVHADDIVEFGKGHVFVGELPALKLMGQGPETPAAIIGCNCLSTLQGMLLKLSNETEKEVWFESRQSK